MKNYRKIYEEKCGIKIPDGYDIHHIDFDRNNNDITNLVMLPKKLHQEYHKLVNIPEFKMNTRIKSIFEIGIGHNWYVLEEYKKFFNCWEECCKWVNYRDYLLGFSPNMYNLEV